MRIVYYPSFRSLDHGNASGLVSIARDLHRAMLEEGHEVLMPLSQSMEWIYLRPWRWLAILRQARQADQALREFGADCWLTYHSYYRGPDVVGPWLARRHGLPYFILAPSYATKYRRRLKTWPGFHLNRRALEAADLLFVNKRRDAENLRRLVAADRTVFIPPGIRTEVFPAVPGLREAMRQKMNLADRAVVVTAAMMRPGVKEEGIAFAIEACAGLRRRIPSLHLLVLGDGPGRKRLEEQAGRMLPGACTFAGLIAPERMHEFYHAGDVFVFPGINEALGMVYLEAQCCGLPVVATSHDGAPEVVADGETGLIVPPFSLPDFAGAIGKLLEDGPLRGRMAQAAMARVRGEHDIRVNYRLLFARITQCCTGRTA
jgi:glycosyltransferase involved in cell wall biosynthesis